MMLLSVYFVFLGLDLMIDVFYKSNMVLFYVHVTSLND